MGVQYIREQRSLIGHNVCVQQLILKWLHTKNWKKARKIRNANSGHGNNSDFYSTNVIKRVNYI